MCQKNADDLVAVKICMTDSSFTESHPESEISDLLHVAGEILRVAQLVAHVSSGGTDREGEGIGYSAHIRKPPFSFWLMLCRLSTGCWVPSRLGKRQWSFPRCCRGRCCARTALRRPWELRSPYRKRCTADVPPRYALLGSAKYAGKAWEVSVCK